MSLKKILEGKSGGWQIDDQQALNAVVPGYELTEKEAKEVVKALTQAIDTNDLPEMIHWLVVGLTRSTTHFLLEARSNALFRLVRYNYQHDNLTKLLRELMTRIRAGTFTVQAPTVRYFEDILRLHSICEDVHGMVEELKDNLRKHGHAGLKAMLMMVDLTFFLAERGRYLSDKSKPSTHPFFFSPEDIAESFSFAFKLFTEQPGNWPIKNAPIDMQWAAMWDEPTRLLKLGALVRYYHQMEILVDAFGFTLEPVSSNRFELHPPYPDLLRAMRYGYIRFESQLHANFARSHDKDRPNLSEIATRFMKEGGEQCVVKKDNPERFTFAIPMLEPLLAVLGADRPYQEEYQMRLYASMELMTPVDELLAFEVVDGITIEDILKFHRQVNFLRWFSGSYFMDHLHEEPHAILQSLLVAQRPNQYVEYFGQFIDQEKVEAIVDLFSYLPNRDKLFDVQYQPIIRTENGTLFGLNIFGTSNIIRNVLQHTRFRKYHDGTFDPLKNLAREALKKRADYVHPEDLNYAVGPKRSDVDVLVYWDSILFILECKNALHPAGVFELRNSYEYILKATSQLNLFRSGFADPSFRSSIEKRIGHPLPESTQLVTGILVSNRMFLGLRIGQNGVRGAFEMEQFLNEGTIMIGGEVKRLWKGRPTGQDLAEFFDDNLSVSKYWAAMTEFREEYRIGRYEISALAYKLEMEKLADNFEMPEVAAYFREEKEKYLAWQREQDAEVMRFEELAERMRHREA